MAWDQRRRSSSGSKLDITSVDELKIAADADKLASLPGMGKKSQQKILDGIEALARQTGRASIGEALCRPRRQILDLLLELPGRRKARWPAASAADGKRSAMLIF